MLFTTCPVVYSKLVHLCHYQATAGTHNTNLPARCADMLSLPCVAAVLEASALCAGTLCADACVAAAPQIAARMTFMACSRMSLRAVSDALRAAEASSSTSMEATDSLDRLSRAVASRDLHSSRQCSRQQCVKSVQGLYQ